MFIEDENDLTELPKVPPHAKPPVVDEQDDSGTDAALQDENILKELNEMEAGDDDGEPDEDEAP